MDPTFLEYLQDPDTPLGVMDAVYGACLLYGLIRGAFRGFAGELAGLLGTLVMLVGAWTCYEPVSAFIMEHTRLDSDAGSNALAYALLVLLFLATWKLVTWLLRKALDWTCPPQIRRSGGALMGVLKSALVLSLILTIVNLSGHGALREQMIRRSWFGRATQNVVPGALHQWLPGVFPEPVPEERNTEEVDGGSGNA